MNQHIRIKNTYVEDLQMSSIQTLDCLNISAYGSINAFKYSQNGRLLALGDSEGYIHIFHKNQKNKFVKGTQFKVEDTSILSISWTDPKFGNILGIGTNNNKVYVFQEQVQSWKQIAFNFLHSGPVNCVQWAPCGLKLFSGGLDGKICILQCKNNRWKTTYFLSETDSPILSFCIEPIPLGESIKKLKNDEFYPRLAVIKKDMKILFYCHQNWSHITETQSRDEIIPSKSHNQNGYLLIFQKHISKQAMRGILWRPAWGNFSKSLAKTQIIFCTQQGLLKLLTFEQQKPNVNNIHKGQLPLCSISQSLTGNCLTVTSAHKDKHQMFIFEEKQKREWELIENKII